MDKIQINKIPKGKAMEFKQKDEVVVVDEKITTVFEATQVKAEPTPEQVIAMNRRRMEAYSDCA
jgi:hypothetical protein